MAAAALAQPGDVPQWLIWQVIAGCKALASCAELSCSAPQLSAQAAYRLGAACSLVLGPGRAVLEDSIAAAQLMPSYSTYLGFASICRVQVKALAATLTGVLSPEQQPQAAAAFAGSAAKPAALLPLLAALSDAIPLIVVRTRRGKQADRSPWSDSALCLMQAVIFSLLICW